MTIRYIAKSTQVIPFDNQQVMVVSAMVDKKQLLDNFTMDELMEECRRRHNKPDRKPMSEVIPETPHTRTFS